MSAKQRFEFGKNWKHFLTAINEERITSAENSLKEMLGVGDLKEKRFLDIGCGSGLFSLAARRLGAYVHSFDYDPQSVACTNELKEKYFPGDPNWTIEEGSVLDAEFLNSLGEFDVVYSWGVLHHTGAMWQALRNACTPVKKNGRLFLAIYNDQGWKTLYWAVIKRTYNKNICFRLLTTLLHFLYLFGIRYIIRLFSGRLKKNRGMSLWHDMKDWLGGYPFEVAKPEEIFSFCFRSGFSLERLKTCGGRHGCNEFVFIRT